MKYIRRYRLTVLSILLIVLLVLLGNGRGRRHWEHIESSRLVFSDGLARTGETYGVMNEGPALTLPAGVYTLSWDIETDGQGKISITTTNDAAISPTYVDISAQNRTGTVSLDAIDQLYNLQLPVSYESGSYLRVNRIDLIGNAQTDGVISCIFVLAAVALLNILHVRGWLTPRRRGELIILSFVVLISSIPTLKANLNGGHDGTFHTDRLLNMLNALRSGQFPARLGAYMENQYGSIASVFYPELFLYFPAALMLCGATLNYAMHAFLIAINVITALIMRYSAGRLFKNSHVGMLASILYTLCAYRLTDMYTRFSIGEALAMAFLPLFIYALYEVVLGDARRWKLLALSGAAIYQSHLISASLCGIAAVAVCTVFCVRIVKQKRFILLFLSAAVALGLCLYALLPLYTYSRLGINTSMMARNTSEHLLAPAQLFLSANFATAPSDSTLSRYALVIGLPLIVGAAAALHVSATKEKRGREDVLALVLIAVGACFAVMTTTLFPWGLLEKLTHGAAAYIQFPWRLLMGVSVCLSMAGGYGLAHMTQGQIHTAQLAVFALCASLVLPQLTTETRKENYVMPNRVPLWDQLYEDYTMKGTIVHEMTDKTVHTQGDVVLTKYEKFGTRITAHISSTQGGEISFPLFAFDGYEATLNGEAVNILRGENNRITLKLPAQTDGDLLICFTGRAVWRIGEAISLLTALALILHGACSKRRTASSRSRRQNA